MISGREIMKVELRNIDNNNMEKCMSLKVADEQRQYISSNEDSLKEAAENETLRRQPMVIQVHRTQTSSTQLFNPWDWGLKSRIPIVMESADTL